MGPQEAVSARSALERRSVLFICAHDGARSQMAEAFLNKNFGEFFEASSASLEPGEPDPLVSEVMEEIGIALHASPAKSVFDVFKSGKTFAYIITICDSSGSEHAPTFPGLTTTLHCSLPAPSAVRGSPQEKLACLRKIRDTIKLRLDNWCAEFLPDFD